MKMDLKESTFQITGMTCAACAKVRATKIGNDTALSQIIKIVENAQGSKALI
jgi:hypothetical protein